jgi:hypothetical protein
VALFWLNDKQFIDYHQAPRDFADGARSLASLFGLVRHVPISDRADLRQVSRPDESRGEALKRIYFNIALSPILPSLTSASAPCSQPACFNLTGPTPNSKTTNEPSWIASIKRLLILTGDVGFWQLVAASLPSASS